MIENRTFDEVAVGESARDTRTPTEQDIQLFALVSGDVNPAHMDPARTLLISPLTGSIIIAELAPDRIQDT